MQTYFILLVGSRGALLLRRFGKEEEKAWILPNSGPALHEAIAKALKERPQAPLRVILDCKSLDLKREGLPPVNPVSRQKIVGRQGSHHFAKSFLRGSGSWRDGAVFHALHAACEAEPHIEALLQQVHKLSNPIDSLSFLAAEWGDYATQLFMPVPRPWAIALILSEAIGLRHIVLKDGKAAFTRLHEECVPSLGAAALGEQIALHLRSTREFLPRLDAGGARQVPAQLFVPSCLESLATSEHLRALDCRVIALKAPQAGLLPPEWEADLVYATQAAEQKLPLLPVRPFWMRERSISQLIRQVVVILMIFLGMAGIYMGSKIMFERFAPPPAPPVSAEPPPKRVDIRNPPELHLEAVIYNGPEDWSVWINGQKFTAAAPEGQNLRVTGILPDGVGVHWEQDDQAKDYVLRQENAAAGAVH